MINDSLKETESFFAYARDSQSFLKEIEVLKKRIEELENTQTIYFADHTIQYNKEEMEYMEMVNKYNLPTCSCHGVTFEKFLENKNKQ